MKGVVVFAQAGRTETAAPAAALPAIKLRRDSAGLNVDFMCLSHLISTIGARAEVTRLSAS